MIDDNPRPEIQLRITTDKGGDPCEVIPVGKTRRYTVNDVAECQWAGSEGLGVRALENGIVEVTGSEVGQESCAHLLTAHSPLGTVSLRITVVGLESVTATIHPTPPLGKNPQLYRSQQTDLPSRDPAVFRSAGSNTEFPEDFDAAQMLVLLRGNFPDVLLQPAIVPGNAPVDWRVTRSGTKLPEHKAPALPTLTELGTDAKLSTDATGAFVISARPYCTCAEGHEDVTIALRLVLVDAEFLEDRTKTNENSFIPGNVAPFGFAGEYGETDVGTYEDTIQFDADIRVISGGPDGRLYLSEATGAIGARWCNNMKNEDAEFQASYTEGKTVYSAYILRQVTRHKAHLISDHENQTQIFGPLWDGSESIEGPEEIKLSTAETKIRPVNHGAGCVFTATCRDHPNGYLPVYYPRPGSKKHPLTGFSINQQFTAAIYLWSASAPWVIGIACTMPWGAQVKYDVEVKPKKVEPTQDNENTEGQEAKELSWNFTQLIRSVNKDDATRLSPLEPADRASIQVWEPSGLDHLVQFVQ